MSKVDEFYKCLEEDISRYKPDILNEFRDRWKSLGAKNVFLWLQGISDKKELPDPIERHLTDLYFYLR